MCKMTVLVSTYNQPLSGIYSTLNSIINQNFDDYEIVVADDCSKVSPESDIRTFFEAKDFSRYKIVINSQNLGTVLNMNEGLKIAEGEYVKWIGAGDMLFAPNTLEAIYSFSLENQLKLGFGRIMTFFPSSEGLQLNAFNAPLNPFDYKKDSDSNALAEHQLTQSDWVPGGSLFFKRDFLLNYLEDLSVEYKVRYCEDLVTPLVLFDEPVLYLDEYILWYEWGVGVSNDGSSAAKIRMYTDHDNYFNALAKTKPNNKKIQAARRMFKVKRFLALHTPIYSIARKLSANRYLRNNDLDSIESGEIRKFLDQCLWEK